jgi:hypothetical protein
MSSVDEARRLNEELAHKVNEEVLRDPTSPYAGKMVGIANGQVVVVADDLDEVIDRLREAEPDPKKRFVIEAGLDYSEVHDVGELA